MSVVTTDVDATALSELAAFLPYLSYKKAILAFVCVNSSYLNSLLANARLRGGPAGALAGALQETGLTRLQVYLSLLEIFQENKFTSVRRNQHSFIKLINFLQSKIWESSNGRKLYTETVGVLPNYKGFCIVPQDIITPLLILNATTTPHKPFPTMWLTNNKTRYLLLGVITKYQVFVLGAPQGSSRQTWYACLFNGEFQPIPVSLIYIMGEFAKTGEILIYTTQWQEHL
jgi:hypothetical protein